MSADAFGKPLPQLKPSDLLGEDIFTLLGFDQFPQEKKDQLAQEMISTIEGRVLARMFDLLSNDELHHMEDLIDQDNQAAIQEFLQSHKVNIAELTAEEALLYKAEIVSLYRNGQAYPATPTLAV